MMFSVLCPFDGAKVRRLEILPKFLSESRRYNYILKILRLLFQEALLLPSETE